MRSLVLLVALGLCCVSVFAKMQNVTVKGIAVCNKKRLANVHVELYDKDTLDPNDLLAEMHTNSEGEFELFGQEDEVRCHIWTSFPGKGRLFYANENSRSAALSPSSASPTTAWFQSRLVQFKDTVTSLI
ncbi:hypothetical protein Y032_0006g3031 [Ancylostoma ceylanicum]|uniref:Transthyretin-like family protein n=1 Tax=Ancylostoma ceylanicum TaxID=53326 RepID=A0A016VS40_9BILA|nr:hypothetical protein Y032_0006g3031 [Ancylostoma ceylanicum]